MKREADDPEPSVRSPLCMLDSCPSPRLARPRIQKRASLKTLDEQLAWKALWMSLGVGFIWSTKAVGGDV